MAHRALGLVALSAVLAACTTSPLGRSQLKLLSESQMEQMGAAAFQEIEKTTPVSRDPAANRYVQCVADAVTRALAEGSGPTHWEVQVFRDETPNAFALPGGKIGVNTGILAVARNQDQLATVIGHEVAHVIAGHANERVSTAMATEAALQTASLVLDTSTPGGRQMLGLLGAGAQIGVLMPYSRAQESEADLLGLDLMARAGFDPRESVNLWRNMQAVGGAKPPEFLSTHPADATRMQKLAERVPSALQLREQARASGRRPSCS
jgi:predicted Zn-dependent protease